MKRVLIYSVCLSLVLTSCNRQEEEFVNDEVILSQSVDEKKLQVMKELSMLLGKTLSTTESRKYVVDLIRDRNDNSESISVNALLG